MTGWLGGYNFNGRGQGLGLRAGAGGSLIRAQGTSAPGGLFRSVQPKKILGDFEIDNQPGAIHQRGDKRRETTAGSIPIRLSSIGITELKTPPRSTK